MASLLSRLLGRPSQPAEDANPAYTHNHAGDERLLFLHVPKTGGTTFNVLLETVYGDGYVYLNPDRPKHHRERFEAMDESALARVAALSGHVSFGLHEVLPFPVRHVTILREPVDRVISTYEHIRQDERHPRHRRVLDERMSLLDFANSDIPAVDNVQTRLLAGYKLARETPRFEQSRELLDAAFEHIDRERIICGVLHRFDRAVEEVAEAFGWSGVPTVERQRSRGSRPAVDEIDPAVRDRIRERNALDAELFDLIASRQGSA